MGNEDWLVPASHDERRFAVFNVGDEWKQNLKIFGEMMECLTEHEGRRLLLHELQNYDLSNVNVNKAPSTKGLLDQKLQSLHPIDSWLFDSLIEGNLLHFSDFSQEAEWPKEAETLAVHEAVKNSTKNKG